MRGAIRGATRGKARLTFTLASIGGAALLAAALTIGLGWPWLLDWWLAVNLVTVLAYGWDKLSARHGWFRIPERTLHVLAMAGGWLGALAGRTAFHHKTRKPAFLVVALLSAVTWVAAIGWYLILR